VNPMQDRYPSRDQRKIEHRRVRGKIRRRESAAAFKEHGTLLILVWLVGFILMLFDVGVRNSITDVDVGLPMAWFWVPILLVGTPVLLIFMIRGKVRFKPWFIALGICGGLVFLMDVGGLTVRRFVLLPVWGPPIGAFLLYWLISNPSRSRAARARRNATKPPLAAHIHGGDQTARTSIPDREGSSPS
jgi:hypothetical protein